MKYQPFVAACEECMRNIYGIQFGAQHAAFTKELYQDIQLYGWDDAITRCGSYGWAQILTEVRKVMKHRNQLHGRRIERRLPEWF